MHKLTLFFPLGLSLDVNLLDSFLEEPVKILKWGRPVDNLKADTYHILMSHDSLGPLGGYLDGVFLS